MMRAITSRQIENVFDGAKRCTGAATEIIFAAPDLKQSLLLQPAARVKRLSFMPDFEI
ncbi:MAG: hypothetical protein ACI8VI_000760 [Granulosicoccus sp.]